jgi:hypothetical protein
MRRTSSDDETRRGDDRPTLPPIRDLFSSMSFSCRHVLCSSSSTAKYQESCLNPYILALHRVPLRITLPPLTSVNSHYQRTLHTAVNKAELATPQAMDTPKLVVMVNYGR